MLFTIKFIELSIKIIKCRSLCYEGGRRKEKDDVYTLACSIHVEEKKTALKYVCIDCPCCVIVIHFTMKMQDRVTAVIGGGQ